MPGNTGETMQEESSVGLGDALGAIGNGLLWAGQNLIEAFLKKKK
jgi:hypothetical protein